MTPPSNFSSQLVILCCEPPQAPQFSYFNFNMLCHSSQSSHRGFTPRVFSFKIHYVACGWLTRLIWERARSRNFIARRSARVLNGTAAVAAALCELLLLITRRVKERGQTSFKFSIHGSRGEKTTSHRLRATQKVSRHMLTRVLRKMRVRRRLWLRTKCVICRSIIQWTNQSSGLWLFS